MLVKITTSIAGIEVGRFVTLSTERGMAWIQRGFAVSAGPDDKETPKKTAPEVKNEPEPTKKPGRPARK